VREVEPWTIDSWRGRWYLAGFDLGRDDARVFRLDRINGPVMLTGRAPEHKVPDRLDVRAQVDAFAVNSSGDLGPATLRVREGTCFPLRRGASSIVEGHDGWDTIVVKAYADTAGWLAEYGPDVVVLEPPSLRADVIAALRAVMAAVPRAVGCEVPAGDGNQAGKQLEVAS
jgi:proteasome accessory factor B